MYEILKNNKNELIINEYYLFMTYLVKFSSFKFNNNIFYQII